MSRQHLFETLMMKAAEHIRYGSVRVTLSCGSKHFLQGREPGPDTEVIFNSPDAAKALLVQGDIGFAESFMRDEWEAPDLESFMRFVCINAHVLEQFYHGNRFFRLLWALLHRLNPNTKSGSRKNITAHYDLGNDFYELWLDETMTYSSALFKEESMSLEEAQLAKYQRLLDKSPGSERVLEIGCGWGGFAESAARDGRHVTGLTISPSQAEYAEERLKTAGLHNRAQINLRDYRDEKGLFDTIVSIEMFEAVGERYWPSYFTTLRDRMKPGGNALIQTITIADEVFPDYRLRGDFIQRHIFPGGMLPSKQVFAEYSARAGLKVEEAFSFGKDYARTLSQWLKQFDANITAVRAMGFNETFIRKWRFYLAYCLGAFASGRTDVVQYELRHA